jgi:DNA-binding MarR family transcriptional regulator
MEELVTEIRANQTTTDAFDDVASEALGINRTDSRCLDILDRAGPMTAGRLAEASRLTTAAVTGVLDRLELAGYASRVRDAGDRRRILVDVTPLLNERAEVIWGPIGEHARRDLQRMTIADLELLRDFFRRGRELNEREMDRVRALRFEA